MLTIKINDENKTKKINKVTNLILKISNKIYTKLSKNLS